MAPLVSVTELQARPGFGSADPGELAALLDDASALVREIAEPNLDTIDHTSVDRPPAIVPVVVSMVRRGFTNPRGLTGEQIDDYAWQAQGQGAAGTIYATRREVKLIRRIVNKLGAGTVQLEGFLPRLDNAFERGLLDSL